MNVDTEYRRRRLQERLRKSHRKSLEGAFDALRNALRRHGTNREIQFVSDSLYALADELKNQTYSKPFNHKMS